MKQLSKYFIRGLIAILPVALTLYLLYIFLAWSETLAYTLLGGLIGNIYVPGMGLAIAVAFIIAVGYLLSVRRIRGMITIFELPFNNIPVVRSIYSSVKSFADYFSPSSSEGSQQVVILRIPDQPIEFVGLVTRKVFDDLPEGFTSGERVAVYLPMGYMIGGYTIFVPTEWVQPISMSVEEAMRSSLIAWMSRGSPPSPPPQAAGTSPQQESPTEPLSSQSPPQRPAPEDASSQQNPPEKP